MGKLFANLVSEGLFNDWASLLDWFFNDNKFEGWSPNKVGKLTKRIKKLPNVGKRNYDYDSLKRLSFPKKPKRKNVRIIIGKSDSEVKDWVRHLRNGIAHGRTNTKKQDGVLWIEIEDFNKNGMQTAYMFMPMDYILKIHRLYKEIADQN